QHPVDSAVLNRFTIYLDRWKALLDPEVARHLQFASIDCRFMICEILAVENAVRVSEAGSVRTPLLPADLTTLDQTEWWKNEKFALAFYEATPFKGYQLITLYIHYPDHP
ncbi:MAG TPA: hypothetical protein VF132_02400, partial [Rudaea sp.]